MSYVTQPLCLNAGTKKEVTVTASAGTPQLLGALTGPVQVRAVNFDTVRVGLVFGTLAAVTTPTLATSPTVQAGSVELFTVQPNQDGSAVYWNIIGDTSPTGNKFEVTQGAGY